MKSKHQRAFLAAYRLTASLTRAAEAARVQRGLHYRWLEDAEYAAEFERAKEEAAQTLEDEAIRRAHQGVDEPLSYKGQLSYPERRASNVETREEITIVDTSSPPVAVRKYSDTLLQFLLKGFRPEKYRDRGSVELTGAGGGPIELVERLAAARQRMAQREDASES